MTDPGQTLANPGTKKNLLKWLIALLTICIVERVLLFVIYPPVSFSDTGVYRRLADTILNGWKNYDGTRTPGYPLFMAVVGSDKAVVAVQMALGILITLIIFYIGYKVSHQALFAGISALAHTLNLNQLFFETNLITETLATFWVILSLLGAFIWINQKSKRTIWLGMAIGLLASLAALTRPLFIFLPFWLAIFLTLFSDGFKIHFNWRPLASTFILSSAIIGCWINYIHENYYMWSMSSLSGFIMVQHTGYYFEYVPDKFASLRDTYIEFRDERIAKYGTQGNAIWDAIPEMQRQSGYSFFEMSRLLSHLSMDLIREHPNLYLKYAVQGWWMFWLAPVYYVRTNISSEMLGQVIRDITYAERALLIGCNALFLISSGLSLFYKKIRTWWNIAAFWALTATTIWICSIVQTLLDHGDNPRFLVPLQSMVVLWVIWILYQSYIKYHACRQSK